ncbi:MULTISPECIES: hypothetical protein [unclassified Pseudodesulfovibrio]|uniref:hypothetical protein n=1 Tax=unclassified Pseudodesulfovibrio TaxID=2661612 RepID=UPI000FEC18F2|nr:MULTISPECIES: hypothetical protein [unclassified Pseudodesulfovibrio]MCJ2164636.1 hypothetical protein [Pseudodesulfovibrio sp. S3-i]
METKRKNTELDPILGQEEQLAQVNAKPRAGSNRKRPRCITPGCPSKSRCLCPGFDGVERDYSANLRGNHSCGYFRTMEDLWQPSK